MAIDYTQATEAELLAEFAAEQSESAFAEIVPLCSQEIPVKRE